MGRSHALQTWFGLSYASFLVLPRVLMQEMPVGWQDRMAGLLREMDEEFPNRPRIPTTVRAMDDSARRLIPIPQWAINYRHPDKEQIDQMRKTNTHA